jgi:hypothetical protein
LRSNAVQIAYATRPDATPETEISVLAQIYKFVLQSRKADEPAPEPVSRDVARRESDHARAITGKYT